MIHVSETRSYLSRIDELSIANGIASLGIYSLNIGRHFTEAEKEENRKTAATLSREEWSARCEQARIEAARKIETLIDAIHSQFVLYQYKDKRVSYSKDDWDLFFWCNKGDMSYVKLNPNRKRPLAQQWQDAEQALALLKTLDVDGVEVSIQYTCVYDEKAVTRIVEDVMNQVEGKFVQYLGMVGKVKAVNDAEHEPVYRFFKKGARSRYIGVGKEWFLNQHFSMKEQQ